MTTSYVVLRHYDDDEGWKQVGECDSGSASGARTKARDEHGEGTYVAVPARSFVPETFVKQNVEKWTRSAARTTAPKPIDGQVTVDDVLADTDAPDARE